MTPLIDNYVKSGQVSYEFRNFVRDALDLAAVADRALQRREELLPAYPRAVQGSAQLGR